MTTTTRPTLLEAIEPALADYSAAIGAHSKVIGIAHADRCSCGWEPARPMPAASRSRAVGLHVSAAWRRASKAYDAATDRIIATL